MPVAAYEVTARGAPPGDRKNGRQIAISS